MDDREDFETEEPEPEPEWSPPRLSAQEKEDIAALGPKDVRGLVYAFYAHQRQRIRLDAQIREVEKAGGNPAALRPPRADFALMESRLISRLGQWAIGRPGGEWSRSVWGVGPIISAGLAAHIDVSKTPTAGGVWRFAGLDPTLTWGKGEVRPYNANLKVLLWKLAGGWVRGGTNPKNFGGQLYRQRKAFEVARDEAGGNAAAAAASLERRTVKDKELKELLQSGHLPAGQLDLRARRWAEKLFLAAYHEQVRGELGLPVPLPYALTLPGHAHRITPDDWVAE